MSSSEFKTVDHFIQQFKLADSPAEQLLIAKRWASQNYKRGLLHTFNSKKS